MFQVLGNLERANYHVNQFFLHWQASGLTRENTVREVSGRYKIMGKIFRSVLQPTNNLFIQYDVSITRTNSDNHVRIV